MEADPHAARERTARPHSALPQPARPPSALAPSDRPSGRPDPAPPASAPSPVMALLQDHLPLTLLLDLAWGVRSQEVYDAEPADLSWLRPAAVA